MSLPAADGGRLNARRKNSFSKRVCQHPPQFVAHIYILDHIKGRYVCDSLFHGMQSSKDNKTAWSSAQNERDGLHLLQMGHCIGAVGWVDVGNHIFRGNTVINLAAVAAAAQLDQRSQ